MNISTSRYLGLIVERIKTVHRFCFHDNFAAFLRDAQAAKMQSFSLANTLKQFFGFFIFLTPTPAAMRKNKVDTPVHWVSIPVATLTLLPLSMMIFFINQLIDRVEGFLLKRFAPELLQRYKQERRGGAISPGHNSSPVAKACKYLLTAPLLACFLVAAALVTPLVVLSIHTQTLWQSITTALRSGLAFFKDIAQGSTAKMHDLGLVDKATLEKEPASIEEKTALVQAEMTSLATEDALNKAPPKLEPAVSDQGPFLHKQQDTAPHLEKTRSLGG